MSVGWFLTCLSFGLSLFYAHPCVYSANLFVDYCKPNGLFKVNLPETETNQEIPWRFY